MRDGLRTSSSLAHFQVPESAALVACRALHGPRDASVASWIPAALNRLPLYAKALLVSRQLGPEDLRKEAVHRLLLGRAGDAIPLTEVARLMGYLPPEQLQVEEPGLLSDQDSLSWWAKGLGSVLYLGE